jgi:hypothetical protein
MIRMRIEWSHLDTVAGLQIPHHDAPVLRPARTMSVRSLMAMQERGRHVLTSASTITRKPFG